MHVLIRAIKTFFYNELDVFNGINAEFEKDYQRTCKKIYLKLTSSISFSCFLGAFKGFFFPPERHTN